MFPTNVSCQFAIHPDDLSCPPGSSTSLADGREGVRNGTTPVDLLTSAVHCANLGKDAGATLDAVVDSAGGDGGFTGVSATSDVGSTGKNKKTKSAVKSGFD